MTQIANVRDFDGTDDVITLAIDTLGAAPNNAIWAAIVNPDNAANFRCIMGMRDASGGGGEWEWGRQGTDKEVFWWNDAAVLQSESDFWADSLGWMLIAITRADGTSTIRWHKYRYSTTTWTHTDDNATGAEPAAATGSPLLRIGAHAGADFFDGKIAVVGYGRNLGSVPTDTDVETLEADIAAWDNASFFQGVWLLDQASVGTSVVDRKGNSDQTAITGTTVAAESTLAFDVGGAAAQTITGAAVVRTRAFGSANVVRSHQTGFPSADSVDGAWTTHVGGTDLAAQIDETVASDADYIQSEVTPINSGCRVKLASMVDPLQSGFHEIWWRTGKDFAGSPAIYMTVKLRQGGGDVLGAGTLIATRTQNDVGGIQETYIETLSGAEADAITDYADLYLEFFANQP